MQIEPNETNYFGARIEELEVTPLVRFKRSLNTSTLPDKLQQQWIRRLFVPGNLQPVSVERIWRDVPVELEG